MEVELIGKVKNVVCCFKFLDFFFSKDVGPHRDEKIRVGEGLKAYGALKMMFYVMSLSLRVKRELYERVVIPAMLKGEDNIGMRIYERHKLAVFETRCLRNMCRVARMDRWRNEE